jgi:hypothetical protein
MTREEALGHNGSMLRNNKNYDSNTSISFYKPRNTVKKKLDKNNGNRSSVSVRSNNASINVSKPGKTHIESKRKQLIKSIDEIPDSNHRNNDRAIKHHRIHAQHRPNSSMKKSHGLGVGKSYMETFGKR